MKKYLILLLMAALSLCSYAQVNDSVFPVNTGKLDTLNQVNDPLRDSLEVMMGECQKLKTELHYKDSTTTSLERENASLKAQMDTLVIIVMSARLKERYVSTKVDKAMSYYNTINSIDLKNEYRFRAELLNQYGAYYYEIKTFLDSVQNDKDRKTKFRKEIYKPKCLDGFRKLSYYRNYISDDSKLKIQYLQELMKEIEMEINRHGTPDKDNGVYLSDFGPIISRMED